jgi:enoyl-CoA hydratase/carnithine racemase
MAIKLPRAQYIRVEIPAPHILLVTIDREERMNALPTKTCWDMDAIWNWFDNEPEL